MTKKKPDNVVDNANTLPYPTNVGAPAFTVPDVLQNKQERGVNATHYLETKFDALKQEYFKLVEIANDTELVYSAKYNFIPVVGKQYYLYDDEKGGNFLSIIEPQSWKQKRCLGTFLYTSENVWMRKSD
jgi:hypothetical protein